LARRKKKKDYTKPHALFKHRTNIQHGQNGTGEKREIEGELREKEKKGRGVRAARIWKKNMDDS
jgi:hypothetical protein